MEDKITTLQALNYVKQWIKDGNHDKAKAGLKEILKFEPENKEAQALLETYTDPIYPKADFNAPFFPKGETDDKKSDIVDTFNVNDNEEQAKNEAQDNYRGDNQNFNDETFNDGGKKYPFKPILVSIIILALSGGCYIAYNHYNDTISNGFNKVVGFFYKEEKPIQNIEANSFNEANLIYDSQKKDSQRNRNDIRTKDLKKISGVLEDYYKDNFKYPSVQNMEKDLMLQSYILEIPIDPLSGEFDKNGEPFDYYYAIYDDPVSKDSNQIYVLSANFENDEKEDNVWSISSRTISFYDDYRDLEKENVTVLKGYSLSGKDMEIQEENLIEKDFDKKILNLEKFTAEEIKNDDNKRREDIKLIKTALESYYEDNSSYPDADIVESLIDEYISKIPVEKYNLYQNDKEELFGYFYTVLPDDTGSKNQSFVLSTLIAKSGKLYTATSENIDPEVIKNKDSYRNLAIENVTVFGASKEELKNYQALSVNDAAKPRQTKLNRT